MDPICAHTPWFSSLPPSAPLSRVKQHLTWIFNSQERQNNWESTWVLLEIYSLIFSSFFFFFGCLTKRLNVSFESCQFCLTGQTSEPCRSIGDSTGEQVWHWRLDHWLNIIELYKRCAVSLFVCDWFSDWLNPGEGRVSFCYVCLPAHVCAHLCVHPRVETLTDRTRASLLYFFCPCLCRFVPTLCARSQSATSFFLLFFFCLVNIPIFTCACSFPPVGFTSVSQHISAFATRRWMERRGSKSSRDVRGTEQGEEGGREGEGGGGRLITVAGLVAWRRRGPGMPGC